MAKKKNSMALFEIVSKEKKARRAASLGVPGWMRRRDQGKDEDELSETAAPVEGVEKTTVPAELPQAGGPDATRAPAPRAAYEPAPVISAAEGRLSLTLNYVSWGVVLLALVLLLILAFALGRHSVPNTPVARASPLGIESAQALGDTANQGPAREETGGNVRSTKTPPERQGPRPETIGLTGRTVGKYYLVIQAMGGRTLPCRLDAEGIAEYCKSRGYKASVFQEKNQYIVWSEDPFDSTTSTEAQDYAWRIHNAGQDYKRDFKKKYDFNQCDSDGHLKPVFKVEKAP